LTLDLSKVPKDQRKRVKEEIGEFVSNEVLRYLQTGNSPVSKRGRFKSLNKNYADEEKGGNRTANLELDGDMLDAFGSKNTKDGIEVGIIRRQVTQSPKADGHNNLSGESKLPTRRFVPSEEESFKQPIMNGVKRIIKENERQSVPERTPLKITERVQDEIQTAVTIEDAIGEEILTRIIGDIFGEG
jgi:hypothetical protein